MSFHKTAEERVSQPRFSYISVYRRNDFEEEKEEEESGWRERSCDPRARRFDQTLQNEAGSEVKLLGVFSGCVTLRQRGGERTFLLMTSEVG